MSITQRSLFLAVLLVLVLSACAQPAPAPAAPAATQAPAQQEAAPTTAPAAPKAAADASCGELKMEDFTNAKIDWTAPAKAAPGGEITIHVAALSHPYINALRPYVPLFTEMTGINVVYDILPVEEFWTKTAADLQGGTGFYDLVHERHRVRMGLCGSGLDRGPQQVPQRPQADRSGLVRRQRLLSRGLGLAHAWNGEYGIGTYGKGTAERHPGQLRAPHADLQQGQARQGRHCGAEDLGRMG